MKFGVDCRSVAGLLLPQRVVAVVFFIFVSILFTNNFAVGSCPAGMVLIPADEFTVACAPGDGACVKSGKPGRSVVFAAGFCMDVVEVAQGEYVKLTGSNPSYFAGCGESCPVEQVNLLQAAAYCEAQGKRLPTEDEWEYAARGGAVAEEVAGSLTAEDIAWYMANAGGATHPSGGRRPNAFGLYDMAGNVWEWTTGCYAPGREGCGMMVLRGGSWQSSAETVSSFARASAARTLESRNNGFRCVMDADRQQVAPGEAVLKNVEPVVLPARSGDAKFEVSAARSGEPVLQIGPAMISEQKIEVLPARQGIGQPVFEISEAGPAKIEEAVVAAITPVVEPVVAVPAESVSGAVAEQIKPATAAVVGNATLGDPAAVEVLVAEIIPVDIAVPPQNKLPVVSIIADVVSGEVPLVVAFRADCADADGVCVSVDWDFGDGSPQMTGTTTRHGYPNPGAYKISVLACDDRGACATAESSVEAVAAVVPTAQPEATTAVAAASSETYWARTFGLSALADVARCVRATSDGGYIVAGYTSAPPSFDMWVLKLDGSGEKQWAGAYGGEGQDIARSIAQTPDGGYVVAGYTDSSGAGGLDFLVVRVDAGGKKLWEKTYGGLGQDTARSIIALADGGYVVAGESDSFGSERQVWVLRLAADGTQIWANNYEHNNRIEGAAAIRAASDGGFIVAGYSRAPDVGTIAGRADSLVMKIDAAGNQQWSKTFGGADWDEMNDVAQTPDGGYVAAGVTQSTGVGDGDMQVVKYDADGKQAWSKTYGDKGYDVANGVVVAADGSVFVAGGIFTPSGRQNVRVLKLDVEGKVVWSRQFGGSRGEAVVYSVDLGSDGGPVVAGYSYPAGGGDWEFFVMKLAPDGGCPACF